MLRLQIYGRSQMTKEREKPASAIEHHHRATNETNFGCFSPISHLLYETASQT